MGRKAFAVGKAFFPRANLMVKFPYLKPFGNCIPVREKPSDERYRNFSMAIAYIDSYRNRYFWSSTLI